MPHFSKELLDAAPESLDFLREVLHGSGSGQSTKRGRSSQPAAMTVTREERLLGRRMGDSVTNTSGSTVGGNPGRTAPVRRRRPASLIGA
ncbi:hypothetical protein [Methylorubrum suomiense]|uniref:Uncharacterized protein n=1 Tax=Methylorubrum suomiense TaxID=144191 RepID=A0ABQ4UWN9_9HYPH|nr:MULTISPECIES: hypothetical protein [Methylobacteriaceae]GJE76721.1 hypothetical protein BGCPKDLD_3319 [Methylorubrum suomiense]